MAGSPFFSEKFHAYARTFRHFTAVRFAICLLLVPARSIAFVVLLAALASIILILIHHIHLLMYVPTIAVIVMLRHYLVQGFFNRQKCDRRNGRDRVPFGPACSFAAAIPGDHWLYPRRSSSQYLQKPHGRPHPDQSLELQFISGISRFLSGNSRYLGSHAVKTCWAFPCFALLIWLHAPTVEILCQF